MWVAWKAGDQVRRNGRHGNMSNHCFLLTEGVIHQNALLYRTVMSPFYELLKIAVLEWVGSWTPRDTQKNPVSKKKNKEKKKLRKKKAVFNKNSKGWWIYFSELRESAGTVGPQRKPDLQAKASPTGFTESCQGMLPRFRDTERQQTRDLKWFWILSALRYNFKVRNCQETEQATCTTVQQTDKSKRWDTQPNFFSKWVTKDT